jgi:hypothetical protein
MLVIVVVITLWVVLGGFEAVLGGHSERFSSAADACAVCGHNPPAVSRFRSLGCCSLASQRLSGEKLSSHFHFKG